MTRPHGPPEGWWCYRRCSVTDGWLFDWGAVPVWWGVHHLDGCRVVWCHVACCHVVCCCVGVTSRFVWAGVQLVRWPPCVVGGPLGAGVANKQVVVTVGFGKGWGNVTDRFSLLQLRLGHLLDLHALLQVQLLHLSILLRHNIWTLLPICISIVLFYICIPYCPMFPLLPLYMFPSLYVPHFTVLYISAAFTIMLTVNLYVRFVSWMDKCAGDNCVFYLVPLKTLS